jgi:protein O-mannosyl-transferase
LLSMLFFLLALGTYRWYVQKPGRGRYALVAMWFALGLMAKPQVITLPFVLLLWDYWPLERLAVRHSPFALRQNSSGETRGESKSERQCSGAQRIANSEERPREWGWLLLEKLPLFLLCVVSSILTMQAQRAGGAVASLVKYPLWVRVENALVSYARYLGKAIWPVDLAPMYPHPGSSLKTWEAVAALCLLLGITTLVWDGRRQRYLLVGWLWFLGTMVPMIGIVQVGHQAMADRYAYLPFIGLFIMVCWGVPDALAAAAAKSLHGGSATSPDRQRWVNRYLAIVSLVGLLALAVATHRQLGYWSDNLTLWSRVSQVIGPNLLSEERSGDELLKRGRPEAAMIHYMRALIINPTDPDSNFAMAVYEQKHGDLAEAIERYRIVASTAPSSDMRARALTYMSYAYRDLGDTERARESLQAAEALSSQR